MIKKNLTICVDADIHRRLEALSADTRLSRGHLVREALRQRYGVKPLPPNADAPWVNRNGEGA